MLKSNDSYFLRQPYLLDKSTLSMLAQNFYKEQVHEFDRQYIKKSRTFGALHSISEIKEEEQEKYSAYDSEREVWYIVKEINGLKFIRNCS